MSIYADKLADQMIEVIARVKASTLPNPVQATVTSVSVDPATGARSIFVGYGGAVDIVAMWSSAFDVAIQVVTGGDITKLVGTPVMVVTSSTPPYIDDLIVRS